MRKINNIQNPGTTRHRVYIYFLIWTIFRKWVALSKTERDTLGSDRWAPLYAQYLSSLLLYAQHDTQPIYIYRNNIHYNHVWLRRIGEAICVQPTQKPQKIDMPWWLCAVTNKESANETTQQQRVLLFAESCCLFRNNLFCTLASCCRRCTETYTYFTTNPEIHVRDCNCPFHLNDECARTPTMRRKSETHLLPHIPISRRISHI